MVDIRIEFIIIELHVLHSSRISSINNLTCQIAEISELGVEGFFPLFMERGRQLYKLYPSFSCKSVIRLCNIIVFFNK